MKPVVVTVIATATCWLFESVNVALQVPAALGVTVNVADGPLPDDGATVATPVHVSLSPNAPVYPVSWTRTFCAAAAPVPFSANVVGLTLSTPDGGAVGVGDGNALDVALDVGLGVALGVALGSWKTLVVLPEHAARRPAQSTSANEPRRIYRRPAADMQGELSAFGCYTLHVREPEIE